MQWQLRGDRPIYQQIMEKLTEQIVSGQLNAGDKVPPVRELAAQAGVNPNTMQRALADLEREGLMHSNRTSGRYVTEDRSMIAQIREQIADERIFGVSRRHEPARLYRTGNPVASRKAARERGMIFYGTEQASGRMQRPDKKLRQLYCTEKSRSEPGARPVHRPARPERLGQNDHHQTAQRSASADLGHDHRGRRTAGTLHAQHRQLPARPRLSERLDEGHGRHRLFLGFLPRFRPRQGNRNVQKRCAFPRSTV